MKCRAGFVSNSSSSSFVAVGYKFDEETFEKFKEDSNYDNLHDKLYDRGLTLLWSSEGGIEYNKVGVVSIIAEEEDCALEEYTGDLDSLRNEGEIVKEVLEELGIKPEGEVRLIVGTRMC